MHWAAKYIGIRHVKGGRDQFGFDCWGLLQWIYKHEFDIDLPPIPGIQEAGALTRQTEDSTWIAIPEPIEGCAVAMSQVEAIHHVGIYLEVDGGKVLHCRDECCVVAERLDQLKLRGFHTIRFYRHRLWHTS